VSNGFFNIVVYRSQWLVAGEGDEPAAEGSLRLLLDVCCPCVAGGAGDYFDVSETVVMMDSYAARDVTEEAKAICAQVRVLALS
jgi:hypothetical protein